MTVLFDRLRVYFVGAPSCHLIGLVCVAIWFICCVAVELVCLPVVCSVCCVLVCLYAVGPAKKLSRAIEVLTKTLWGLLQVEEGV